MKLSNLNNSDVEVILKYVIKRNIEVKELYLHNNQLTRTPDSIGKLPGLTRLYLENNHLITLPDSIGQLASLDYLNLSKNQLTELPDSIGQLPRLLWLDLQHNQLEILPESIGQLKSLEKLDLGYNQLRRLPESIGKLTGLTRLDLQDNHLTTLPESIGQLASLIGLDLTRNYLTIPSIQFQNGKTFTIGDQKNKENLKKELQNEQQAKKIIDEKVSQFLAKNQLGKLTLKDIVNDTVLNSLDQSKVPININNKKPLYSLIGFLN